NWLRMRPDDSDPNASWLQSTPNERPGVLPGGKYLPVADVVLPAWTPSNGESACKLRGPAKSCLPAWIGTVLGPASTWRSHARFPKRWKYPSLQAEGSAACRISSTVF